MDVQELNEFRNQWSAAVLKQRQQDLPVFMTGKVVDKSNAPVRQVIDVSPRGGSLIFQH